MLALICGAGDLPAAIAGACEQEPLICALDGFQPEGLAPHRRFRLETLGSLMGWLKAQGVGAICLCGHVRRPRIDLTAVDEATAPLVPRLKSALALGDDGALRQVLALFEDAGFDILAAHHAAPALLPPPGVPTRAKPGAEVVAAVPLGEAALQEMAAADLGQACVIRGAAVLEREDETGTDAMLRRLPAGVGPGAFLFKGPKPGQDRRADLPVIGPRTATGAAEAGLAGLVIDAGGVMALHRTELIETLDARGLFLWVRERSG